MARAMHWTILVAATLVAVGVAVQVYLIGADFRGADALDAHRVVGHTVHGLEAVIVLAAIGAYWRRWRGLVLPIVLFVIGSIQIGFAEGDRWVGGLHGLLGVAVLVLAAFIAHRQVRDLGLGRHATA